MRYYVALLAIIIMVLFGYAMWQRQQYNTLPNVHIADGAVYVASGETYDRNTSASGIVLTHTFRVENPHPFAVGLKASTAGYTCTTATISASIIPPHGTAEVTLHVEPEIGKFTGSASIVTTHEQRSAETRLIVSGQQSD